VHNCIDLHPTFGDHKGRDHFAQLYFQPTEKPLFLEGHDVSLFYDDSGIQGIRARTTGLEVQDDVFQQLSKKFGKPKTRSTRHFQNAFGAKYDSIHAEWSVGKDHVVFDGRFYGDTAWGVIYAFTPHEAEVDRERDQEELAGRAKL
jgi:hypothetical protein